MALPRRRKATAHEMLPHMDASVRFWPVTAVDPRRRMAAPRGGFNRSAQHM